MKFFYRSQFRVALLLLTLSTMSLGAQTDAGINASGPVSQESKPSGPSGQLDFQTDLFTGRFGYAVPLPLAPARHGSEPSLELRYSSAGDSGWCGVGWDLDLGYIERETRFGVPVKWSNGAPLKSYDDTKGFTFSFKKQVSKLVNVTDGLYRAETEDGSFLQFQLLTNLNQWVVTDKSGNQYFFGTNSASRMSNGKTGWPSNAWSGTFRWALNAIQTVNGDTTTITYTNIAGSLYPLALSYNGFAGSLTNSCSVQFVLASRSDVRISLKTGYRVDQSRILSAIVHKVGTQVVWSNKLNYVTSSSTQRSLLASVTRYGTNLTSALPPVTFGYSQQKFGFQSATTWTNLYVPSGGDYGAYYSLSGANYELADMDGDGLPDRLIQPALPGWTNWWVQHNTGAGFGAPVPWGPLGFQTYQATTTSNSQDWTSILSSHGRVLDINGDARPDWVLDPLESYFNGGSSNIIVTNYNHFVVQLNGGTNLLGQFSWTNVVDQLFGSDPNGQMSAFRAVENVNASGSPAATYVRMIDMNGDGLPDRVMIQRYPPYTYYVVQFNNGNGGFTGTNYFGPYQSQGYSSDPNWATMDSPYVRLMDINGDGLPDRVMLIHDPNSTGAASADVQTNYVVELNNGYGFEPAMTWTGVDPQYHQGVGTTVQYASLGDSSVVALRDINGDGLPDRILQQYYGPYTNWWVQVNTGNGFAPIQNFGPYTGQDPNDPALSGIQSAGAMLLDMNGDGLPDRVEAVEYPAPSSNYFVVQLSSGPFPDLLTVVSNGMGGAITTTYKPSTLYDNRESTNTNARQLLPFPMYTVASLAVGDGVYQANTNIYLYEGGMWNFARREFNGFAKTTEVDPLGATNLHWFHQAGGRDNSVFGEFQDSTAAIGKRGRKFRVDTFGTNGQPYKLTLNKVGDADLGSGWHFGFISQTLTLDYPGSLNSYRATAQQFRYDLNTGNLTNTIDYGEVTSIVVTNQAFTDIMGDTVYKFTAFASLANTSILDKPQSKTITSDSAGQNILRETLFAYDGNTGNLTQQRDRMCPTCYVTNSYGYDGYNNRNSATDEAGITTTTTYDSAYQTFPVSQTEAGTFTSSFTCDARSGKLLSSTDPKGLVTVNSYDALLRLLETDTSTTPNGAANVWLTRVDYNLGTAGAFPTNYVHVRKNDDVDAANGHETWTYSDGLGRTLQVRDESEVSGFRVADTVYDKRGNVRFQALPYFSSGASYTRPVTGLGTLIEYDPVGRQNKVTPSVTGTFASGLLSNTSPSNGDTGSPVGPATIAYDDGTNPWLVITTDEDSKVHKYLLDAYGRTNQIVEVTGNGNYSTFLGYTLVGDLTNVTDSAGNQIQYAYNDLGQLVAMADPDMGVWQYQRDYAGRLRNQIDADNQTVVFNYDDALGRLHTRQIFDYRGTNVYTVTNFYDSSDDANFTVYAGQLYKVTDNQGWQKNGYDVRGRTLKTARYLSKNGNTYTNQFACDDQNRVTLTVYPNGGPTVTNIYDTGGNLSQVKQVGGSNTVFYTARGFDALDQLTGITFGNTAFTTNAYYPNSKRLHQVVTRNSTAALQNLTYSYDNVANLKGIADGVYTTNASATLTNLIYDDLHRLTSLTRPAVNTNATTFGFDSLGNITANGENGGGTYNYGSRMPHAVKSANGKNYAYDANGNMLVRGNQRLSYDPENRLILVVTASSADTFGYDLTGARLWKQGTNSLQVWIDGNYEEKNGQILFHVLAGGRLVCTFDKTGTNVFAYYHPDNLHSTAVETDQSGNKIQHYEYMAFGQDRFTESATAFPVSRRYTSQVLDEDTGLYYYGARYYDPQLARFIQPDTAIPHFDNPQYLNRYSYVLNNPLRYRDPNGNAPVDWANAMQPAIDDYYGGYTSDPNHTSTLGLFGAYMGQSTANGYADMLRLGTGLAEGSVEGIAADLGRAGGIILTVAVPAAKIAGPKAAPEVAPAPKAPKPPAPEVAPEQAAAKGPPKPSPNFKAPTNPPQQPPAPNSVPAGWRVRLMPPTTQYPNGYWVLEKPMPQGGWQRIDPSTMKPGPHPDTHVPLPPPQNVPPPTTPAPPTTDVVPPPNSSN